MDATANAANTSSKAQPVVSTEMMVSFWLKPERSKLSIFAAEGRFHRAKNKC
jgi:hypothetical protein